MNGNEGELSKDEAKSIMYGTRQRFSPKAFSYRKQPNKVPELFRQKSPLGVFYPLNIHDHISCFLQGFLRRPAVKKEKEVH